MAVKDGSYSAAGNQSHTSRLVGQRASWLLRLRAGRWADVEPTVRRKLALVGDRAALRKEFTAERAELAEKAFKRAMRAAPHQFPQRARRARR